MESAGFDSKKHLDQGKNGAHIATALQNFNSFQSAINGNHSFTDFLKNLRNAASTTTDSNPLSTLFLGASWYFQSKRPKTPKFPSSIREMLYWLSAMTVTPQFGELLDNFSIVIGGDFQVAISGSLEQNEKLSSDDLAGHLITSCISSPWILGTIQGPGETDSPLLHDIYSSSEFSYPSSPSVLLSKLTDYAYALQFQLHFLYQQCSNFANTCGWRECQFGKEIEPKESSNVTVSSHICHADCQNHSSGACKHGEPNSTKCGHSVDTASPLQAFLTDKLKGFRRDMSDPYSHLATCSGSLCHVPMGFNPNDLRAASNGQVQGVHIAYALGSFCGGFNTPLRQLCEKPGCLTKRTPRTLGDLFGFTWHLNGQLYNQRNAEPARHNWVTKLANLTPFSSTVKEHINVLKTFVGTGHTDSNSHNTADLSSLYSSGCNQQNQNCGPYLYPLTHSDGATFAPTHASTYLSWVLYLSDDLQSWFQDMLDEFKDIDCKVSGCIIPSNGKRCSCNPANHGSDACSCPSIVQCGGTLPLLYRHGFRYYSPAVLMGSDTKRDCKAFAQQLESVIAGNPLTNLLNTIDTFLYAIRWEFFSKLSGFWSIYICLILYTFFFLLDTLHLRSHLKLTSTHGVPPLALLTAGTPLPITKLTYLTQ